MVLQRLRLLPWRRVDVSFAGAAFGSAHNNIQVGARLSVGERDSSPRLQVSHMDWTGRKPAGSWVLGTCIWGSGPAQSPHGCLLMTAPSLKLAVMKRRGPVPFPRPQATRWTNRVGMSVLVHVREHFKVRGRACGVGACGCAGPGYYSTCGVAAALFPAALVHVRGSGRRLVPRFY